MLSETEPVSAGAVLGRNGWSSASSALGALTVKCDWLASAGIVLEKARSMA